MIDRRQWLTMTAAAAAASNPLAVAAPEGAASKSRLKSAICAYSYRDALAKKTMSYEDLIRLAVDLDVDGLDMTVYWFPSTDDGFLYNLRRQAYRMGVEIYSISVRTDLCRPTPELRTQETQTILKWIDVANKIGAGHIRVFGGNVPKGETEDRAAGWCVEVLKRASEYAGQRGIILGLENHGGITARAERILDIVNRVKSPWVAVNLDTGNFEREVYPQIEKLVPYAANVQVKAEMRYDDGTRREQDWDAVVGLVAKGGYKGYMAIEYEAKEPVETAMPRLMKKLQGVLKKYSA